MFKKDQMIISSDDEWAVGRMGDTSVYLMSLFEREFPLPVFYG
jgi:hypothetical protein